MDKKIGEKNENKNYIMFPDSHHKRMLLLNTSDLPVRLITLLIYLKRFYKISF